MINDVEHRPSHDGTEPVTDRIHDHAWAADLEQAEHAVDPELIVEQAIKAVEGTHVQLVTHEEHGHLSVGFGPSEANLPDSSVRGTLWTGVHLTVLDSEYTLKSI